MLALVYKHYAYFMKLEQLVVLYGVNQDIETANS